MNRRNVALALFGFFAFAIAPGGLIAEEPVRGNSQNGALELLLLDGDHPIRLQILADIDGSDIAARWDETFIKLFQFFDRNADGSLDRSEAARLPSAFSLRQVLWGQFVPYSGEAPSWTDLDCDKDSAISLKEVTSHYRRCGLGSMLVGVGKSAACEQLTEALLTRLDTNKDGKLEKEECKKALQVLAKVDRNDDELIGPGELVDHLSYPGAIGSTLLEIATSSMRPDVVRDSIPVMLYPSQGDDPTWKEQVASRWNREKRTSTTTHSASLLNDSPQVVWRARLRPEAKREPSLQSFEPIKETWNSRERLYYASPALHLEGRADTGKLREQIESSRKRFPSLFAEADANSDGVLDAKELSLPKADLFKQLMKIGDRNGDERLSREEFSFWLELQVQIASGHALLTILDLGAGLFELLDADHDGALSVRELRNSWDRMQATGCTVDGVFEQGKLPRQLLATISHGHPRSSLGKPVHRGPEWFHAMDRNGDGDLSRREFTGPRPLFERLDRDHDGLLSPEEAANADFKKSAESKPAPPTATMPQPGNAALAALLATTFGCLTPGILPAETAQMTEVGLPQDARAVSAVDLAAKIDHLLQTRWTTEKVPHAPLAGDPTFLRRVYLDLVGRIPTVGEAREFLGDPSTNKRALLVHRLIDSASHARHMATFWRREWIPQADTPQFAELPDDIESWIAGRLIEGTGYDQLVRDLLTVSRSRSGPGTPLTFLVASEYKPENLAANMSRAFLGVNLDCAQCHDHPFARWTRDQFWETAAFFARPVSVEGKPAGRAELPIPNTKRMAAPRLLGKVQPTWPSEWKDETGRILLADWVTGKENPYFAKNAVNRAWANLFGTGIVEPLDDLSGPDSASHPELLNLLAENFAQSGYDLKFLTAALVLTQVYQQSSILPARDVTEPRWFARSAVRGLTGEQLYDSLRVASGQSIDRDDLDPANALRERKRFAGKFRLERPGNAQRSILQALSLMNGKFHANLSDLNHSPTLKAAANAPFLDTQGKLETLFLATYARFPKQAESQVLIAYIEKGGVEQDPRKALSDVFWALINSTEFNTNH